MNQLQVLPSQLLAAAQAGVWPMGRVAVDTETSGLHVDSGARVSTVSVAWLDHVDEEAEEPTWAWADWLGVRQDRRTQHIWDGGIGTWGIEEIDPHQSEAVVSFAWPFDQGVAGTGKVEDDGQGTLWPDTENLPFAEWVALLEWLVLVGKNDGLTMHHAKFDLHQLEAGCRRWPGVGVDLAQWVDWDTQNVADLLWSKTGTSSLKPTAQRLWGGGSDDEQKVIKRYLEKAKLPKGRWDLMPWDVIAKYADQDARLTIRLDLRERIELREAAVDGWLDGKSGRMTTTQAVRRRLLTSKMLRRVERRGLPFDVTGGRREAREIAERVARREKALPFFPATLPMAKHYWFGTGDRKGVTGLGLQPYETTETGLAQLNQQIIGKMVAAGVPAADLWRDIQKLNTATDRWYTGWSDRAGADGRLRTSVRQNGTVSGRFSVENIQLQAIPHDYRLSGFEVLNGLRTPRQLIGDGVPEGWQLWELDLAQAELRVAALYAGCKRMLQLIDKGADLHGDACEQLFDVHPGDPTWGQMRNVAKRANFSLIFGVGWLKLQADIEEQTGLRLTDREAQVLVRDWNALYPEYQAAIRATMAKVEARQRSAQHGRGYGWITLTNGERRWFKPGEDTHKAFNQRVQPNLAQFGIDWWLNVEEFLMEELGDDPLGKDGSVGRVGMVLMVHDSMVLLLPDGEWGDRLVQEAVDRGVALWATRFPGVPGGVDAKQWVKPE